MPIRLSPSWCWHLGLFIVASSLLTLPDALPASPAATVETQAEGGAQLNIGDPSTYERPGDRPATPPTASAATPGQAAAAHPTTTPRPGLSQDPKWFGVLQSNGRYGSDLKRAGISLATLELAWDSYEPQPGAFDAAYAAQQRQKAESLRSAGVGVVLDLGLQYSPDWLFTRDPNAYFVNQYGDRYATGRLGTRVGNGVFDPLVRQAQGEYIRRVASDLGDSYVAVRIGGGWYGELHYPPASYNGHSNSYWAYDANAIAGSPVKGWTPGQPSAAQAQAFWRYYTTRLADYLKWEVTTYRSHFSSSLEVLYPGWGVRPGEAAAAIGGLLGGGTPSEANGEMQQGNDFAATLTSVADPGVIAYSTWLEAPDKGVTPNGVSPIRYLQQLVVPRGLAIAGENSDSGRTESSMRVCVERVRTIPGMAGMMWLAEQDLVQGGQRTLGTYARLIRG